MAQFDERMAIHGALGRALAALSDTELLELVHGNDAPRVGIVARCSGVAAVMNSSYRRLFDGEVTAAYPAAEIGGALEAAGLLWWDEL